ncbi:MAG: hypothetical protein IPH18_09250 [Chitinophagaceae bacterium]|nr:hypothetical protein [Chitinophagaceae bacterium]
MEVNSYLLQLAGGDSSIARIIMDEILKEIPDTKRKLNKILETGDLGTLNAVNHHMISTFAPLGGNTTIMKMINTIRTIKSSGIENLEIIKHIQELISEIDSIEKTLSDGYIHE